MVNWAKGDSFDIRKSPPRTSWGDERLTRSGRLVHLLRGVWAPSSCICSEEKTWMQAMISIHAGHDIHSACTVTPPRIPHHNKGPKDTGPLLPPDLYAGPELPMWNFLLGSQYFFLSGIVFYWISNFFSFWRSLKYSTVYSIWPCLHLIDNHWMCGFLYCEIIDTSKT